VYRTAARCLFCSSFVSFCIDIDISEDIWIMYYHRVLSTTLARHSLLLKRSFDLADVYTAIL